jgi:hypothetical protein
MSMKFFFVFAKSESKRREYVVGTIDLFGTHLSRFCKLAEHFLIHHQETIPHFRHDLFSSVHSEEGAGGIPDGGGRQVELVPLVRHGQLRSHQAGHPAGFT